MLHKKRRQDFQLRCSVFKPRVKDTRVWLTSSGYLEMFNQEVTLISGSCDTAQQVHGHGPSKRICLGGNDGKLELRVKHGDVSLWAHVWERGQNPWRFPWGVLRCLRLEKELGGMWLAGVLRLGGSLRWLLGSCGVIGESQEVPRLGET